MSRAITLGMASFKTLALNLLPDITVCIRGRHGIGKSQSVYQIAAAKRSDFYKEYSNCVAVTEALNADAGFRKIIRNFWRKNDSNEKYAAYNRQTWHYDMGLPVIERRLGQTGEGDMLGIPILDRDQTTLFTGADWYRKACKFPCILFLDELNRANAAVRAATFQIGDSRTYYGYALHDETVVYTAVNIGDNYQVDAFDPAEISRYAVIDLNPTVEDWLTWAYDNVHPALAEFIRANERALEVAQNTILEPNGKYPDRRAWARLDECLRAAGLYETPEQPLFLHMAAAMVGHEAANAFWNFCKSRNNDITAEEVVTDWKKAKRRMPQDEKLAHGKYIELIAKLGDYFKSRNMTSEQAKQLAAFGKDGPVEARQALWGEICSGNGQNVIPFAPHFQQAVCEVLLHEQVNTAAKEKSATPAPVPMPRKRNGK